MRHQLIEEYPNASEATLNALYKRRVVQAYNLDSDDEGEVSEGKLLLEADSLKVKDKLIEAQKKFLTPTPPEPKAETPKVDQEALQRQRKGEFIISSIKDSSLTKDLLASKSFSIGEGADKITMEVPNPSEVLDLLLDYGKYESKLYSKKDGVEFMVPDVQKQLLLAVIANDTEGFFKRYNALMKSLGSKEVIEPIENASANNKTPAASSETPTSIAGWMAKQGKMS